MIKIDVVSGFLGAGKTTLIKKLLQEALAGSKTVLIENEFGEIGIDGGFLQESGIEIKEMNSGCICCSLVGDFGTSLKEVITTYAPDRILIEPSGVGKLSDVLKAVQDVAADLNVQVNSAVAVVDASKAKMYIKNFGEFFINQIEHAGTIILSRTDKVNEQKLQECVELIRKHNEVATIITTPLTELDGSLVLQTIEGADSLVTMMAEVEEEHHHHGHHHQHHDEEECCCGHHHEHEHEHHHDHGEECCCGHHHEHEHEHEHHHHHDGEECECGCGHHHDHHHADEVFTSWGKETPKKYTVESIKEILRALDSGEYGTILRAKGMLPDEDGIWHYFDYVPMEREIRSGSAQVTGKLCVIGANMKEDKLEELFA